MPKQEVSRQRRYQIRRRAEGKCEICGRIEFRAGRCRKCYIMRAMRRYTDDPERVEALTKRILFLWWSLETANLKGDRDAFTPDIYKWVLKTEKMIGGSAI